MSAALIPARQKDVNRAKVCDDNFIAFVQNWQGEVFPKPSPEEPILDGSACSAGTSHCSSASRRLAASG